jgi:hypothetical protein
MNDVPGVASVCGAIGLVGQGLFWFSMITNTDFTMVWVSALIVECTVDIVPVLRMWNVHSAVDTTLPALILLRLKACLTCTSRPVIPAERILIWTLFVSCAWSSVVITCTIFTEMRCGLPEWVVFSIGYRLYSWLITFFACFNIRRNMPPDTETNPGWDPVSAEAMAVAAEADAHFLSVVINSELAVPHAMSLECIICMSVEGNMVVCKSCTYPVDIRCARRWNAEAEHRLRPTTCPMCRASPWILATYDTTLERVDCVD